MPEVLGLAAIHGEPRGTPRTAVAPTATRATAHHFTVDVEEYFQVVALEPYAPMARWESFPSRVERSQDELLRLLADANAVGTFFVLGWVADRYPAIVRRIAEAGHEVASHGWDHKRITHQTPEHFRDSVRRSKQLLEDQSGQPCDGFRAPSFSIVPGREWALEILCEEGYTYDSSLFPIRRPDGYGYPSAGRDPHWLELKAGRLAEVPPATLQVGNVNVPAGGGGYFRLLPYALCRAALRSYETRGVSGTFYIHPWELDPGQPRFAVPLSTRVRHYGRLGATAGRLRRLLREFRFRTVRETVVSL